MEQYMYLLLLFALLVVWMASAVFVVKHKLVEQQVDNWTSRVIMRAENHGEKTGFLDKLDIQLRYSGLMSYSFMSAEVYLLMCVSFAALLMIVSFIISGSFVFAVTLMTLSILVCRMLPVLLITKRDRAVETELMMFMDMISAYSLSYSDLIDIFEQISELLRGPLKKELKRAVANAKASGMKEIAFEYLMSTIHYENFQFLIDNLRTISQYNTDYSQIVGIMKDTIDQKVKSNNRIDAIYAKGRIELLTFVILGVFCLNIVKDICAIPLNEVFFGTGIGLMLFVLYLAVNVYMLYIAFIKNYTR